jgi:hypothetical protein
MIRLRGNEYASISPGRPPDSWQPGTGYDERLSWAMVH